MALAGLFRTAPESDALPQALRPAVEVIARLSAERKRLQGEVTRLQGEVTRLREALRGGPSAADVARLRRERDAMAEELAALKLRPVERHEPRPAEPAVNPALAALVQRLERAVARVEAAEAAPRRASQPAGTSGPAPRPRGGGMLAGLVRQNVELRSEAHPRPEPPAEPPPAPARGGGLLGGLLSQNLSLRGAGAKPKECA